MTKVTLNPILSSYSSAARINANNTLIMEEFDNTLSRDGSTPNQMMADIDMNGQQLLNLAEPSVPQHAATKQYVDDLVEAGVTVTITNPTTTTVFDTLSDLMAASGSSYNAGDILYTRGHQSSMDGCQAAYIVYAQLPKLSDGTTDHPVDNLGLVNTLTGSKYAINKEYAEKRYLTPQMFGANGRGQDQKTYMDNWFNTYTDVQTTTLGTGFFGDDLQVYLLLPPGRYAAATETMYTPTKDQFRLIGVPYASILENIGFSLDGLLLPLIDGVSIDGTLNLDRGLYLGATTANNRAVIRNVIIDQCRDCGIDIRRDSGSQISDFIILNSGRNGVANTGNLVIRGSTGTQFINGQLVNSRHDNIHLNPAVPNTGTIGIGEVKMIGVWSMGASRHNFYATGSDTAQLWESYFDSVTFTVPRSSQTQPRTFTVTSITNNGGNVQLNFSAPHTLSKNLTETGTPITFTGSSLTYTNFGIVSVVSPTAVVINRSYTANDTGTVTLTNWDIFIEGTGSTTKGIFDLYFNSGNANYVYVGKSDMVRFNPNFRCKIQRWQTADAANVMWPGNSTGAHFGGFGDDRQVRVSGPGAYKSNPTVEWHAANVAAPEEAYVSMRAPNYAAGLAANNEPTSFYETTVKQDGVEIGHRDNTSGVLEGLFIDDTEVLSNNLFRAAGQGIIAGPGGAASASTQIQGAQIQFKRDGTSYIVGEHANGEIQFGTGDVVGGGSFTQQARVSTALGGWQFRNVRPLSNNSYDLGASSNEWRNIYGGVTATGSTTRRTLADRFNDHGFNIRDSGAVGNGTTSDTAALTAQLARRVGTTFNNASAASTEKQLFYPAGRYLLTSQNITTTGTGQRIKGEGPHLSRLMGCSVTIDDARTSIADISLSDTADWGIKFTHPSPPDSGRGSSLIHDVHIRDRGIALALENGTNDKLENIEIESCNWGLVETLDGSTVNFKMSNFRIGSCDGWGAYGLDGQVKLSNGEVNANGRGGILFRNRLSGNSALECYLDQVTSSGQQQAAFCSITSVADLGGGQVRVTVSTPFYNRVNDDIKIFDTTDYDGDHVITAVSSDYLTFDIAAVFTSTKTGKVRGKHDRVWAVTAVASHSAGTRIEITTQDDHDLVPGLPSIVLSGMSVAGYNGTYDVYDVTASNKFVVTKAFTATATGTAAMPNWDLVFDAKMGGTTDILGVYDMFINGGNFNYIKVCAGYNLNFNGTRFNGQLWIDEGVRVNIIRNGRGRDQNGPLQDLKISGPGSDRGWSELRYADDNDTDGDGYMVIATPHTAAGVAVTNLPTLNELRVKTTGHEMSVNGSTVLSVTGTTVSTTLPTQILSGTAIPAGGTAGAGLLMSSTPNLGLFFGSGAPTLSAAKGSVYMRTDGSSTTTRAYTNTDGATTWTYLTAGA